jgi:hypothetical protein
MSENVLRRTTAGIGLALAIATTGCAEEAPPDSHTTAVGTVEDLCARTNEVPKLTKADGENLDVLTQQYMPGLKGDRYVGRLAVTDGNVSIELSPLPADMTASLTKALSDPLVGCGVGRNGWTTRIVITHGKDDGHYNTNEDVIHWGRTTSNNPEESVMPEVGAPTVGIPHEIMHGYFMNWWEAAQNGDPNVGGKIEQLFQLFKRELTGATESFRVTQGKDFKQELQSFMQGVDERKYPELTNALQRLAAQMNVEHGLDDLIWDRSGKDAPYVVRNHMQHILEEVGDLKRGRLGDNHFRDFQEQIKGLEKTYRASLEKYFASSDESAMVSNVIHNSRVGHPYDNFNEWAVSLMNSMRFNPKGVAKALNSLPFDRRYYYSQTIQLLEELTAEASPELHLAIPFRKVLDGFSTSR